MRPETPRDASGAKLCAWCGKGPVPPSRGTKPRDYCSRSCVVRASEARKLKELLAKAYTAGKADATAWAEQTPGKSRDDAAKSRDDANTKSRDFPKPQVTSPEPDQGWVWTGINMIPMPLEDPPPNGRSDHQPRSKPHG